MEPDAATASTTVGALVRRNPRLATVLGDAGIGPRYAAWTIAGAARDRGVAVEGLLARLDRARLASVA